MEPPQALLLDVGGTLDGDGVHWLDRFLALYQTFGIPRTPEAVKEAFYWAEGQLLRHPEIRRMRWDPTLQQHVQYQLEHLGLQKRTLGSIRNVEQTRPPRVSPFRKGGRRGISPSQIPPHPPFPKGGTSLQHSALSRTLARRLTEGFAQPTASFLKRHRELLAGLRPRFRLGVVSNFYGNLSVICEEFGLAPLLEVLVDSAVVNLSKPDPQIFTYALSQLQLPAEAVWYVGDSWERDMVPAKQVGLRTVWLTKNGNPPSGAIHVSDFTIRSLGDLPSLLGTSFPRKRESSLVDHPGSPPARGRQL